MRSGMSRSIGREEPLGERRSLLFEGKRHSNRRDANHAARYSSPAAPTRADVSPVSAVQSSELHHFWKDLHFVYFAYFAVTSLRSLRSLRLEFGCGYAELSLCDFASLRLVNNRNSVESPNLTQRR
jgi:hypothetical protein